MSEVWIANASPVIALAKCGYLDLLEKLSREVLLPHAVAIEIISGPPSDPARQLIEGGWGTRAAPLTIDDNLLEWGLGPGETSVLALARERASAMAVLDDSAARACAKVVNVPVIGSLGIIIRAKRLAFLPSAEAMKALRDSGLYLDDQVVSQALGYVGEKWEPK